MGFLFITAPPSPLCAIKELSSLLLCALLYGFAIARLFWAGVLCFQINPFFAGKITGNFMFKVNPVWLQIGRLRIVLQAPPQQSSNLVSVLVKFYTGAGGGDPGQTVCGSFGTELVMGAGGGQFSGSGRSQVQSEELCSLDSCTGWEEQEVKQWGHTGKGCL